MSLLIFANYTLLRDANLVFSFSNILFYVASNLSLQQCAGIIVSFSKNEKGRIENYLLNKEIKD
jgi:uncharacterized protein YeeX (DUF496 family)